MRTISPARLLVLCVLALSLGGCASDFKSQWASAAGHPHDPFSGRWAGEWRSTRGSHHGALECVFEKTGAETYKANFDAHWLKMSASYAVDFHTRRVGDHLLFEGTHDLGALYGGIYHYNGDVSRDH
jgi:hypothetical protein